MLNRKRPVVLASSLLAVLLALLLTGCGISVRSTNSGDPVNPKIDAADTNGAGKASGNGATGESSVDVPDTNGTGKANGNSATGDDSTDDEVDSNGEKIYKDYDELILAYYKAINNVDADAMFALFDDEFQAENQHMKDYVEERMEVMKDERDKWFGGDWYNRVTAGEPELFSDNIYCIEATVDGEYCDYIYIQKEADGRYYINVETTHFWH